MGWILFGLAGLFFFNIFSGDDEPVEYFGEKDYNTFEEFMGVSAGRDEDDAESDEESFEDQEEYW